MGRSQEKGKEGEEIASRYLLRRGYSIIRRNYRSSFGEVDIIAYDPSTETLVFVEVKHRKANSLSSPLESITPLKIERIKKTALQFLSEITVNYSSVRFDAISVVDGRVEEHVENAF